MNFKPLQRNPQTLYLACGAAGPRIVYSVDKQGLKGLRAGYSILNFRGEPYD